MDQLDRVLVLMSVNSGDSALSHKALYCVSLKARGWDSSGNASELLSHLLFKMSLTVISSVSFLIDYSTKCVPV